MFLSNQGLHRCSETADISIFKVFVKPYFHFKQFWQKSKEFLIFHRTFRQKSLRTLVFRILMTKTCLKRPPAKQKTVLKLFSDNPTENIMRLSLNYSDLQVKRPTLKSFFWHLKANWAKNRIVPVMPRIWSVNTDWGPDFDLRPKILSLKS